MIRQAIFNRSALLPSLPGSGLAGRFFCWDIMEASQSCAAIVNSDKERREVILSKIMIYAPNDCWLWTGCVNNKGYGMSGINRRTVQCHRVAFFHANGYLTDGLVVMHTCDTPRCLNPRHLVEGTTADNVRDRDAKGRNNQQSGDRNGTHTKPWTLRRGDQHHTRLHPERIARGENASNVKMTQAKVNELRADWQNRTYLEAATHFGISETQVARIIHNKTWFDSLYFPALRC